MDGEIVSSMNYNDRNNYYQVFYCREGDVGKALSVRFPGIGNAYKQPIKISVGILLRSLELETVRNISTPAECDASP